MIDLKKQYLDIKDELLQRLNTVLESSQYILGSNVKELEDAIKAYHNVPFAIGVASGTDALHLALRAFGIGKGDEVITTPFTFFATVEAILYVQATPVFVDIDLETFNIDTTAIASAITPKTKAILPVHMFGHPANMPEIMDIANTHNLIVIEDCAQSFGAALSGIKTGSFACAGCFSFYPSKNLGAYGDAGMVILKDEKAYKKINSLRNHGSTGGYKHETLGYNSRLDEIQSAILLVKFKRIDEYNSLRRKKAHLYTELLGDVVNCPQEKPQAYHVYHQYTIRSTKRDIIQSALKHHGIPSVVYYPIPMHLQPALSSLGYRRGDFPKAEQASAEVLSLPIYPELAEEDIYQTASIIKECLAKL